MNTHSFQDSLHHYQELMQDVLRQSKALGATHAEVSCFQSKGFLVGIRAQAVETLEYQHNQALNVTLYFGQQKGQASTTNLTPAAMRQVIKAACRIARLTQADDANGLADADQLAYHYPDLNLYHPWDITPSHAIELAKQCEMQAKSMDARIVDSELTSIETSENLILYANTHGFSGYYPTTVHNMQCTLIAQSDAKEMQRDGSYTVSRDAQQLKTIDQLAHEAAYKTTQRLGAKQLKTGKIPVIFEAAVARSLIKYFLNAISGRAIYQQSSFLGKSLDQAIFQDHITIQENPHLLGGLGSTPFDAEGVKTQCRTIVEKGILQTYLLNSYSARRLGLVTTGHAGGIHNIQITTHTPDLKTLLQQMGTGLLVTEILGSGVNTVTGDYSQGAVGFWIENGEIQYAVEEITIAGNLREMYQKIVAIGGDIDYRSKIQTGSIWIESLVVAGH